MAVETLTQINVIAYEGDRARVQFVTLDGQRLGLRTRWAAFDQRWRLWILAADGAPICGPLTLAPGIDLLLGHKHRPGVPQGQLFVYSRDRSEPTLERVTLYYRSP